MFKLFALVLTLVAGAAHADSDLHTDLPLLYLEQTQGDARNQPLVIFLHGLAATRKTCSASRMRCRPPGPTCRRARRCRWDAQGFRWFTKTPG